MNDSDDNSFVVFSFIGMIAVWIGSGILSWNFIEPKSFGGAIVFLILWAVMGKILSFLLAIIITLLFGNEN